MNNNTPEQQVARLKQAGLNPVLIYGAGSGATGISTATPGGNAGAPGTGKGTERQALGIALQLAKTKGEIAVLNTTAQKQAAEAKNIDEQDKLPSRQEKRSQTN
jgi:hypothetical protein